MKRGGPAHVFALQILKRNGCHWRNLTKPGTAAPEAEPRAPGPKRVFRFLIETGRAGGPGQAAK